MYENIRASVADMVFLTYSWNIHKYDQVKIFANLIGNEWKICFLHFFEANYKICVIIKTSMLEEIWNPVFWIKSLFNPPNLSLHLAGLRDV